MSFYYKLWQEEPETRKRIASGLRELRDHLKPGAENRGVPTRTLDRNLLLATWNIREFDSEKFGPRCPDCFYFIAEIINHFDLVAIQEVRENLRALNRVQDILGGWWKYLVTDVTYGRSGNGERLAFLYDSRKVSFSGLAGEIVLPDRGGERALQLARTPFMCGFRAGWTKFNICSVHIYYGQSRADDPRRIEEIRELARLLVDRVGGPALQPDTPGTRNASGENLILLGDFNIFNREEDETMRVLEEPGFVVPPPVRYTHTNAVKNKQYDQIAFLKRTNRFDYEGAAGVFDFYGAVFREEDEAAYSAIRNNQGRNFKEWRTYQMSDHLVLWTEIRTDYSDEYLEELEQGARNTNGANGRRPAKKKAAGGGPVR